MTAGLDTAMPEHVLVQLTRDLLIMAGEGAFGPFDGPTAGNEAAILLRQRLRAAATMVWREAFTAGGAYALSTDTRPIQVELVGVGGLSVAPGDLVQLGLLELAARVAKQQQAPGHVHELLGDVADFGAVKAASVRVAANRIWREAYNAGAAYGCNLARSWGRLPPEPVERLGLYSYTGPTINFQRMLSELVHGGLAARACWSAHTWLVWVPPSQFEVAAGRPLGEALPELIGTTVRYRGHIDLLTAAGELTVWHPTLDALLADDWYLRARPAPPPPPASSQPTPAGGVQASDYWIDGCRCIINRDRQLEQAGCPVHP